jgi:hypothetical protein
MIDPGERGHQMLLERDALSHRMSGPELRDAMTVHLRSLLTDAFADALMSSPAETLVVAGPRSSQVALSLPFELLFHIDDPSSIVIRRIVPPPRRVDRPRSTTERAVAAFALTSDQHYIPLHLEADRLAEHARSSGIPLVHLAGHGREGAMCCEWRDSPTSMLTSAHLVDAWQDQSPRLVVLGFCESSSERDELRSTQVVGTGEMSLQDYASWMSSTTLTPSSSMAVDLAAALPVAVIALRTNADDAQARRFLDAFFGAHLREGLSVERAYARALADCSFHDGVGLPIPILYVGGGAEPLATTASAQPANGPVRCLASPHRRCVNTFYKATSPLGQAVGDAWGCRITGDNQHGVAPVSWPVGGFSG